MQTGTMRQRDKFSFVLLLSCFVLPSLDAFLLPLLFPLSIKITIHSKPTPPPPVKTYHFETVPLYKEVSIKGSTHISAPKYSYGSGAKYGTSYHDGQTKVYTGLPTIDGHISITSNPAPPPKSAHISITSGTTYSDDSHYKGVPYPQTHYKGTAYEVPQTHYKGSDDSTDYKGTGYEVPQTHYKGSDDSTHYKGTGYEVPQTHYKGSDDSTHYKGTGYEVPQTHYKGSDDSTHYKDTGYEVVPQAHYEGTDDSTHYKGSIYDESPQTHIQGSAYEGKPHSHNKGTTYKDGPQLYDSVNKPKNVYKEHRYIKSVGGYKLTDYIRDDKAPNYDEDDDLKYIAIPPGKTFAEMEAAHKAANARKQGGGPKAYAAEEYSDLGFPKDYGRKYNKGYEHDATYIDDTIPAYKSTFPKPSSGRKKVPEYRFAASASRYDRVVPEPKEKKIYAGFGTSVYGDSYAKVVYVPKSSKVLFPRY